ncbi:MAG: dihydroxyacetone kinase family protein [Atopobium sp.]|uniref:dihydroxyacetone kinase family protein n=1 Tax=Atopobium sp. TaxID=1872650 RepID=UPI002A7F4D7B|nr:dihydroxyacetone kinase family protein [Atopobium sp.]MDY4522082.1 dihydroxyacetone kinase family protein [Atopobium sp.]
MLFNDPKTFREDMLRGYVAAYPDYVVEVPGGVARATKMPEGKIAVINGGGSGHYPAFCGIIGDGFMDATVVGNVFTSPSTDDVLGVARAVEQGSGLFIVGGNYAGDKMNFNMARDILIEEGIDARSFYITDDVASASPEETEKRRGNVGTFMVFKAAGAAAAAGVSFDDLVRITTKANDRTRTMSMGFRGCTLPGANEPLFHVPSGKMEVGQGIHGEPGVGEDNLKPAAEVAQVLVNRVLAEAPADDSKRIAVILDGLGSTKYEELFVVWGTVRQLLEDKGYTLVEPLVGEYVTSLDMEGIALAVEYLDDELETYWSAPADTASFRKGASSMASGERKVYAEQFEVVETFVAGSEASNAAADYLVDAFGRMAAAIENAEPELAKIDGIAGDGDHGRGMVKGSSFALEAAREARSRGASAGSVLKEAGKAWAAKAGGTSGVLWGSALQAAGAVIGDTADEYTTHTVANAVKVAYEKMLSLGGAKRGDKTMLDVLIPFGESLAVSADKNLSIKDAWIAASVVADESAQATANLVPKVGRARPAAERSLGTPDAGAVSMALCIKSVLPE